MKTLDLRKILNCIEAQKKNGTYRNARIGIIDTAKSQALSHYTEPILFKPSTYGAGTYTVESPMSKEQIAKQQDNNSLLTTGLSMVSVPEEYIIEILL
jgi:hypothetical protein